jgi:hypothetical protein
VGADGKQFKGDTENTGRNDDAGADELGHDGRADNGTNVSHDAADDANDADVPENDESDDDGAKHDEPGHARYNEGYDESAAENVGGTKRSGEKADDTRDVKNDGENRQAHEHDEPDDGWTDDDAIDAACTETRGREETGMTLNVTGCGSVGTSRKFIHAVGFRRFIGVVVLRNLEVREEGGE